MTKGKVKIFYELSNEYGGQRREARVNLVQDGLIIYANLEYCKEEYFDGSTWYENSLITEHDYSVYIDKTIDEVIALYQTNMTGETITWLEVMTSVE